MGGQEGTKKPRVQPVDASRVQQLTEVPTNRTAIRVMQVPDGTIGPHEDGCTSLLLLESQLEGRAAQ